MSLSKPSSITANVWWCIAANEHRVFSRTWASTACMVTISYLVVHTALSDLVVLGACSSAGPGFAWGTGSGANWWLEEARDVLWMCMFLHRVEKLCLKMVFMGMVDKFYMVLANLKESATTCSWMILCILFSKSQRTMRTTIFSKTMVLFQKWMLKQPTKLIKLQPTSEPSSMCSWWIIASMHQSLKKLSQSMCLQKANFKMVLWCSTQFWRALLWQLLATLNPSEWPSSPCIHINSTTRLLRSMNTSRWVPRQFVKVPKWAGYKQSRTYFLPVQCIQEN